MIKLSKRLQTIADFVPKGSFVADVGADHGKLGIYLLLNGISKRIQSIENKPGPFLVMKNNYELNGLFPKVDLSLSDGISNLNSDVDTVVIAGMGGCLTSSILKKDSSKLVNVKTIIVDPHRDVYEVRKTLSDLGYVITKETIVFEDRIYYSIIQFDKAINPITYSEDELLFGPILLECKDDLFMRYLRDRINKIDELLLGDLPNEKKSELLNLKERIKGKL